MWYYATFKDYEEAKASAKEDKEQGYKVEIERVEGLGGTTYKVWTWIDESLTEAEEDKEDDTKEPKLETFEDKMDFLAKDEQEAIDGYDKVIAMLDKEQDAFVIEQLTKIKVEEEAHKKYLEDVKTNKELEYTEPLEQDELEEGKTSAQKYNDMLHRTFEMAKKANLAMKDFLIKNGVSEEEAEKLYQDTGLHGSPLQQKLIDMGLEDEFFSKYDYSKGVMKESKQIKESKEDEVMDILKRENSYNESDEFICYNIPEGIITSFNFDDVKDEFESKEELLNSKDGFNLGICENTKENLKKLIAKYKDDILSTFEDESLKEEELEAGDCAYHPERDEYYYLKKTNKPNTFELYTHSDSRGFEVASPRFIDRNSPFYNKLKLHTKNANPEFKESVDNYNSQSYNDKELKEDSSMDLHTKLKHLHNVWFDVVEKQNGEEFVIFQDWKSLIAVEKALKPGFEPKDKYDTSVLDELNIDYGFSDEWSACDNCGKLIRTEPNSYSWVPDFFVDNEKGEIICGDCVRKDPRKYLETLYNNPEVANTILSASDLEEQGFERIGETYENGWYDRNDSPEEILSKALEEHPNGVFIFSITTQGQWATQFELWGAQLDMDEKLKESNGGDVFNEMVNFIENELNHLVIKDKDSKNRILTCYWDNTLSDFYLKEMNGKIIFVEDLEDEDGNPIDWNRLMSDEEYLKDNFANVSTFEEFKKGIKEEDSENSKSDEEEYKDDDLIDLGEDEVPMTFGEVLEMFRHRLSREDSLIEDLDEVARKCALDYIKERNGRKIEREATR